LTPDNEFRGLLVIRCSFQNHGSWNPQGVNFYPALALVLCGVPKFEEFCAVFNVVRVAVCKSHDIKRVPLRVF
jgi:hypothetical protein